MPGPRARDGPGGGGGTGGLGPPPPAGGGGGGGGGERGRGGRGGGGGRARRRAGGGGGGGGGGWEAEAGSMSGWGVVGELRSLPTPGPSLAGRGGTWSTTSRLGIASSWAWVGA